MKVQSLILTTLIATNAVTAYAESAYGESYSYSNSNNDKPITVAQAETVVTKVSTSLGDIFATADGFTLYTFTKDAPGVSNCDGSCAANWPPFSATKNAQTWGDFTIIKRADETYQWAYKNQPLYTWVGDQKQGDINGHGIGKVWYAVQVK